MSEEKEFLKLIEKRQNIVFFGGAGTSTESGIPDFRGESGIFKNAEGYSPEIILSHTFFFEKPDVFYAFYRKQMLIKAKPNITHYKLKELEDAGKLKAVITQNIDGLHQCAGSRVVLELHGSIYKNHCIKCAKGFDLDYIEQSQGVPRCSCGGIIKPDVVLYEEMLGSDVLESAHRYIREADFFIVGGTSLSVYPAAGLIRYYRGEHLALINQSATPFDDRADLVIHEKLGVIFGKISSQRKEEGQ